MSFHSIDQSIQMCVGAVGMTTQYIFNREDWDWCHVHKGTERQFECQKSVTPDMVIEII
jgi:hypothetical protein